MAIWIWMACILLLWIGAVMLRSWLLKVTSTQMNSTQSCVDEFLSLYDETYKTT